MGSEMVWRREEKREIIVFWELGMDSIPSCIFFQLYILIIC